jgi:PPOX class probable F420-dependent enzyme
MTPQEAVDVIRTQHHAVLATTRADGGVQLSPVAAGVDDDGTVVISTRETAMKARNLERRPYAAVCVIPDGFFGGRWVQVEGPVKVEHLPEAMDGLVRYYRSVAGEHPDWDDYRRAMAEERRVLLRITPERAGPSRQG